MNLSEVYFTSNSVEIDHRLTVVFSKSEITTCPLTHPFAYKNGSKCCSTNLEKNPRHWTVDKVIIF